MNQLLPFGKCLELYIGVPTHTDDFESMNQIQTTNKDIHSRLPTASD